VNEIHIAAALIEDGQGRMLLVRKSGTETSMQVGGKIEADENAQTALRRELLEEIGIEVKLTEGAYLGQFVEAAANEPEMLVRADLFRVISTENPVASGEIAEALWVTPSEAMALKLAPLTKNHVLPLANLWVTHTTP
jgi:8-oxo-dGTP diphosphatase